MARRRGDGGSQAAGDGSALSTIARLTSAFIRPSRAFSRRYRFALANVPGVIGGVGGRDAPATVSVPAPNRSAAMGVGWAAAASRPRPWLRGRANVRIGGHRVVELPDGGGGVAYRAPAGAPRDARLALRLATGRSVASSGFAIGGQDGRLLGSQHQPGCPHRSSGRLVALAPRRSARGRRPGGGRPAAWTKTRTSRQIARRVSSDPGVGSSVPRTRGASDARPKLGHTAARYSAGPAGQRCWTNSAG